MRKYTQIILAKTLGLAGIVATISDISQPLAPVASYVMGVSAISLVVLILVKIIMHVWNSRMAISAYFASGLFLLSSAMYFLQSQSVEAGQHGLIASEISAIAELQKFLGIAGQQLENIERSVSSIETRIVSVDDAVTNIDDSVAAMTESAKNIDATTQNIENKLDNIKQETSTDPRKELANMGMSWHYDHFLDALRNQDMRAIELYLQGGMKFRAGSDIKELARYSKTVLDILTEHKALAKDIRCPGQLSFYIDAGKNSDKVDLVSNMCDRHIKKLIASLDGLVATEKTRIKADQVHNMQLEKNRTQCLSKLQSIPVEQYIATMEDHATGTTEAVKRNVLARLKGNGKVLKVLAYRNINVADPDNGNPDSATKLQSYYQDLAQDIMNITREECMTAYPETEKKEIYTEKLEKLNRQRGLLSKYYRV